MAQDDEQKRGSNRGFASMDEAKQRAIASKGGLSVPPEKRSFSQDPHLASVAGRKGGESVPPEGRSFSLNRSLAAEAGRKGGQARGAARNAANEKNRIKSVQDAKVPENKLSGNAQKSSPNGVGEGEDDIEQNKMDQTSDPTNEFIQSNTRNNMVNWPGVRN